MVSQVRFDCVLHCIGVAALPIPIHLRGAPTRLMKEMSYGKEYKYNPDYVDGRVKQDYLPQQLVGRTFLEDADRETIENTPSLLAFSGAKNFIRGLCEVV
jgi:putative ATPase